MRNFHKHTKGGGSWRGFKHIDGLGNCQEKDLSEVGLVPELEYFPSAKSQKAEDIPDGRSATRKRLTGVTAPTLPKKGGLGLK